MLTILSNYSSCTIFHQLTHHIIPPGQMFYQPTHHLLPLGRMFPHLTCQLLSLVHNLILIACIFFRYNLVRFFLLNSLPNETILSLLEIFQPTQLLPLAHILELSFKILPNEYTCKTPLTHSSCIIFLLSLWLPIVTWFVKAA